MISASLEPMTAIRIALLAAVSLHQALLAGDATQESRRAQERVEEALRRESEALVAIADAAVEGRSVPGDFSLEWHNDFFKAQPGTFVPFTLTFRAPHSPARLAFLYIRVERRGQPKGGARGRFAYETIFPVKIDAIAGEEVSVTRGFAVPPGTYRTVLVLREAEENGGTEPRRRGVLLQTLDVPDFWTGQLATSTVMLATRVERLSAPVPADELDEDPYAVGTNRIHVTRKRAFIRSQELIVAFLIYNPSVAADKQFDVQVDYHLYKKGGGETGQGGRTSVDHPPARPGERYVTRTNPQRFNASMMGAQFDPSDGTPVLAGQGILLSEFSPGEYRLGITVADLLSRNTVTRDVTFRVTGS